MDVDRPGAGRLKCRSAFRSPLTLTDASDDSPIVHNRVLLSLGPEAQAFLKSRMVTRQMSPGDVLYETGVPFSHAIFPHTGAISLMTEMEGGRSIEKASVGREGFVGVALVIRRTRSERSTCGLVATVRQPRARVGSVGPCTTQSSVRLSVVRAATRLRRRNSR